MAKEIHVSGIRCYLLPSKVRRCDNADTWDTLHFNIWRVVYKTSLNIIFIYKKTRALGPSPASSVVGRTAAAAPTSSNTGTHHRSTTAQPAHADPMGRWGDGAMGTKEVHLFVLVSFNMHHFHVKDQIAVGWNDGTKTLVPVRHGTGDVQP
jgi:hypothetical protein